MSATTTTADATKISHKVEFTSRIRGWAWRHIAGVGFISALFAALYCAYLVTSTETLNSGLLDVGEYSQAISSYAHFMAPHSPVVGLADPSSAGALQLSDHFTPLLALLAPFYWIHNDAQTLMIETGVLAVLPLIPLWLFTRRTTNVPTAYLVIIGYALSWPIQMALAFAFHEVFLALPIMAWMLERAQAGRLRQAALISLLLLGVKDDMGFVVAVFGIYLATKDATAAQWWSLARRTAHDWRAPLRALRRRHRLPLLALVPIGLGMVQLVTTVLLPAFGGSPTRNFTYTQFGTTPADAYSAMFGDPVRVWQTLFDTPVKMQTLGMLLWPVLFCAFFSPISLLAVPLIAERFLSVNQLYWGMPYHYNAFLAIFVFCAGVDGAARLTRWLTLNRPDEGWRIGRYVAQAMFGVWVALYASLTAHRYPLDLMTQATFWDTSTPTIAGAYAAAAHIPNGVLVASATQIGPHLLNRDKVIMWSVPGDRGYPQTPWVLADVKRHSGPFPDIASQQADVARRIADGYQVVFEQDGWIVLHKS